MIRIASCHELRRAEISPELKKFLTEKFVNIIAEYGMSDMNEVFSVMILSEDEAHYIADKYLEFSEMMYFDNMKYIHCKKSSKTYNFSPENVQKKFATKCTSQRVIDFLWDRRYESPVMDKISQ